jgi:hypothetical protein
VARLGRWRGRDARSARFWDLGHLEETAVLLVCELVGNALRHARASGLSPELRLAATMARLRIEVADADPRRRSPAPQPGSMNRDSGSFSSRHSPATREWIAPPLARRSG